MKWILIVVFWTAPAGYQSTGTEYDTLEQCEEAAWEAIGEARCIKDR